jgi:ubiquinone/menaquinone biosynthesis C-methylase UbiE
MKVWVNTRFGKYWKSGSRFYGKTKQGKDGDTVADVGCGVGYFSLKLAPKVGEHGSVLGEDILDESEYA